VNPARLRYLCEDDHTGYGDAADRLVQALRATGTGVEYRGWAAMSTDATAGPRPCSRDEHPDHKAPPETPTVAHLVPEHYGSIRATYPEGPLVGHTVWETDRLPGHWPVLLNAIDHVVVPTEWNRRVFVESGVVTPISVVPHALAPPTPVEAEPIGLPDDVTVFTTITRWDERKAPEATIEAFLRAFTDQDPVMLVVKTTPRVYVPTTHRWAPDSRLVGSPVLELAKMLRHHPQPPPIHLALDGWSAGQVAALHARSDCYVSLTRGEGWGLGLFDAAAAGTPVVTTGWGAPREWLGADAPGLVDYELATVSHAGDQRSYTSDQRWAEADLDHAVELLRAVAADPVAAAARARPYAERIRTAFAPEVVAGAFARVLDSLEAP
jgi:glycosyltransferase involved in cell wall biosynthesis